MLRQQNKSESGFSLLELIIAMTITLGLAAAACTLLAQALRIRTRANDKVDGLADAQRALNIMSREIANAGFNLNNDNGIVAGDSVTDANGNSTIRFRANLNKFDASASPAARSGIGVVDEDLGEDVKYFVWPDDNRHLLARWDRFDSANGNGTVLANRLDALHIHYFNQRVTYSTVMANGVSGCDITGASAGEVTPDQAKYIVIAACVQQPAVGTPGSPGYQPQTNTLLVSDVVLRNNNLVAY
jgi:prepilin-type N-terminal cleavage/methylation domain-containing protein